MFDDQQNYLDIKHCFLKKFIKIKFVLENKKKIEELFMLKSKQKAFQLIFREIPEGTKWKW